MIAKKVRHATLVAGAEGGLEVGLQGAAVEYLGVDEKSGGRRGRLRRCPELSQEVLSTVLCRTV